jgi:hypothetical protein
MEKINFRFLSWFLLISSFLANSLFAYFELTYQYEPLYKQISPVYSSSLSIINETTILFHLGLLLFAIGGWIAHKIFPTKITSFGMAKYLIQALVGITVFVCYQLGIAVIYDSYKYSHMIILKKPVIYLYPPTTQNVTVSLNFAGKLRTIYPAFQANTHHWQVVADPLGKLTIPGSEKTYDYLFWDGVIDTKFSLPNGFVVPSAESAAFLENVLAQQGLSDREINDFIVYWLPELQENPYNLIHFATTEYTDIAPLTVEPQPESLIRVFMVFKPLQNPIDIPSQQLPMHTRTGFTVVEWGGTKQE